MSVSVSIIASKTFDVVEEAVRYEQEIVDAVRDFVQGLDGVQSAVAIGGQVGTVDLSPQTAPPPPAETPGEPPAPPEPPAGPEQPQPGPGAAEEVVEPQPPDGSDGTSGEPEQPQA